MRVRVRVWVWVTLTLALPPRLLRRARRVDRSERRLELPPLRELAHLARVRVRVRVRAAWLGLGLEDVGVQPVAHLRLQRAQLELRPSWDGLERELRLGAEGRHLGLVGGGERGSLAQHQWC